MEVTSIGDVQNQNLKAARIEMTRIQETFRQLEEHARTNQLTQAETVEVQMQVAQLQTRYTQLNQMAAEMQADGARMPGVNELPHNAYAGNQSPASQWSVT